MTICITCSIWILLSYFDLGQLQIGTSNQLRNPAETFLYLLCYKRQDDPDQLQRFINECTSWIVHTFFSFFLVSLVSLVF